jgi:hypothetical protein
MNQPQRTIAVTANGKSRFSRLRVVYPQRASRPPRYDADLARELLTRTADLPASRRDLIAVLTEYRHALHALAITPEP